MAWILTDLKRLFRRTGDAMSEVRNESIKIKGGEIPIVMYSNEDEEGVFYTIEIDGVEWLASVNRTHAVLLFEMMKDHITDYMHYEKL